MDHRQSRENNGEQEQGNCDTQEESTTISFRVSRSSSLESSERIQLRPVRNLRVIPTEISPDINSSLIVQESNVDASVNDINTQFHVARDDSDPLGFHMNGNYRSIRLSTSDKEPWHMRRSTVVVHVNPSHTSLLESK